MWRVRALSARRTPTLFRRFITDKSVVFAIPIISTSKATPANPSSSPELSELIVLGSRSGLGGHRSRISHVALGRSPQGFTIK